MSGDIQDDIALLLRELGLGDHARPVSPHAVMVDEIAPAIRALRALAGGQEPPEAAIREAVHRTALAAARITPRHLTRCYLTQAEKDAITGSVLKDFGVDGVSVVPPEPAP